METSLSSHVQIQEEATASTSGARCSRSSGDWKGQARSGWEVMGTVTTEGEAGVVGGAARALGNWDAVMLVP